MGSFRYIARAQEVLLQDRLKLGVFGSVNDLIAAMEK